MFQEVQEVQTLMTSECLASWDLCCHAYILSVQGHSTVSVTLKGVQDTHIYLQGSLNSLCVK